jgi:hypothetical protein
VGAEGPVAVHQRRRLARLGVHHQGDQQQVVTAVDGLPQLADRPASRVVEPRQAVVERPRNPGEPVHPGPRELPGDVVVGRAEHVHAEPASRQHPREQGRPAVEGHRDKRRAQRQRRERAHRRSVRAGLVGGGDDRDGGADGGHQVTEHLVAHAGLQSPCWFNEPSLNVTPLTCQEIARNQHGD